MKLELEKWGQYQIDDLFDVVYGVNLELNTCIETTKEDPDSVNFVSRSKDNNGVTAYIKPIEGLEPQDAGIITVAGGGSSVLSTFVQNEPFYSGRDLYLLIPKSEYKKDMSMEVKLYICAVIMKNKYRYSFGRQANRTLPYLELKLPTKNDKPDWKFMESYIKSLHHKPLTTKNKSIQVPDLNVNEWKEFKIGTMFEIYPTRNYKNMSNDDLDDGGNIPFVINSSENNAIGGFSTMPPTEKGNIITFSDTTDGNTFFYQPEDFIGFSHVQGMHPINHEWNKNQYLFLISVLMFHNNGLFNYGRKMRRDIILKTFIRLPIKHNPDGTPFIDGTHTYSEEGYVPDWQYMEDYIKSLPYGDRL